MNPDHGDANCRWPGGHGDTETSGASRRLRAQVGALPFVANVLVMNRRGTAVHASSADLHGVGMGPQHFATVYKTRPGAGLYFGAPMSNRDGQTHARSEIGKGTTFRIELPIGQPASEAVALASQSDAT